MADGRRAEWAERRARVLKFLERHEREGTPLKQLAAEAQMRLPTFYGWVQRLRRDRAATAAVAAADTAKPECRFVEVSPAAPSHEHGDAGLVIELASGHRIRVSARFQEDALRRVVTALS